MGGKGKLEQQHKREVKTLREDFEKRIKKQKNKDEKRKLEQEMEAALTELLAKHEAQLRELDAGDENSDAAEAPAEAPASDAKPEQPTKAMRKKMKRQEKEAEEERAREEARANAPKPGEVEFNKLMQLAGKLEPPRKIEDVAADGNCMYKAVRRGLQDLGEDQYSWQDLRDLAAERLEEEKATYEHFLDEGKSWEEYVDGVRGTSWGSDVELAVLAPALKVKFNVLQAEGVNVHSFGEEETRPIWLSFHRSLLTSEHYNYLVKYPEL